MLERSVLKEHELFLVSDEHGDIAAHNVDGQGLYWRDTRFLSLYELTLEGDHPQVLSAAGEHNFMTTLQCANVRLTTTDGRDVPARTISIRRNRFLRGGLHERVGLFNYNRFGLRLRLQLSFGSDFRDMFDVRGYAHPSKHGAIDPPRRQGSMIVLGYTGLDGVRRVTTVTFDREPSAVTIDRHDTLTETPTRTVPAISGAGDPRTEVQIRPPTATVHFDLELLPSRPASITIRAVPRIAEGSASESTMSLGSASPSVPSQTTLDAEFLLMRRSYEQWEESCTSVATDDELVNAVLRRSLLDLRLLSDRVPAGYLPSAGIPWFSVPFGRDSLITSLQTLSLQPEIARATLRFLADHQGREIDDWRDEQPGKILHEIRLGEMARLGQVPHTPYYGSVDATPLFLVTLGEYLRWTGDLELGRDLRPHAEAALEWLDRYGDPDGDGYVEYASRSERGIHNQGWKDSGDAICHRDGRIAEPPIALAEVQGYVYAARVAMAEYFEVLGEPDRGARLRREAARLRDRFAAEWWLEDEGCFALALDREKRPIRAVSSNPGHCLWSGLLGQDHARRLADRLTSDDMLCGWGIRTLSSREPRFNPMSYHNGSVWPHDNSLIVAGLSRYGFDAAAARVTEQVLDAAVRFPHHRLPELYCGFSRDRHYFSLPAQYPVSCSPQAWAAGSPFLMLQAMLGLRADATAQRIVLRPTLPKRLERVRVTNLRVGAGRVDFEAMRERNRTRVDVLRSDGVAVIVESP